MVAYDPRRHQGMTSRRRRSRHPRASSPLDDQRRRMQTSTTPRPRVRMDLCAFFCYYKLFCCLLIFPLPFKLPGGFFPFRYPIRVAPLLCEPSYFYEYVYALGHGPQVNPFPSRPILVYIRGEGTLPHTLAVI